MPTPEVARAEAQQDPVLLNAIAAADPRRAEPIIARCQMCHTLERGGAAGNGPNLFGIVGDRVGRAPDFSYSLAIRSLHDDGATWTFSRLNAFLANPAVAVLGNRMGFAGIADEEDRAAVIAYLRLQAETPVPLPGARYGLDGAVAMPGAVAAPDAGPRLNAVEFTRGQVEVGQAAYVSLGCETCHGPTLAGLPGLGPALAGPDFTSRWFGGSIGALFERISSTKPVGAPGSLDPRRYAELVAFILHENGFETGARPLRADPAVLAEIGFVRP